MRQRGTLNFSGVYSHQPNCSRVIQTEHKNIITETAKVTITTATERITKTSKRLTNMAQYSWYTAIRNFVMTKISNNCQFVKLCIIGRYFVYFRLKNNPFNSILLVKSKSGLFSNFFFFAFVFVFFSFKFVYEPNRVS